MTGERGVELVIAIDVGTSGVRATAVDLAGRTVREIRKGYAVSTPGPGLAEQDPRDWTERAVEALGLLVRRLDDPSAVVGIGLTGQCPTIGAVDVEGRPVGPGLMYFDNRAVDEAREISERYGAAYMHARTGHVPEAFYAGPKILWLQRHQPDVFAQIHRLLFPRDFVLRRLTGIEATDPTHGSCTLFFDLQERRWATDMMEDFGLDPALFPPVVAPQDVAGTLLASVAAEVGLRADIPVAVGAADSLCAAFGASANQPGPISEMAGSSSCLNSTIDAPLDHPGIDIYPHILPDKFMTEVGVNTAGAAVDWVVRQFDFKRHSVLLEEAERFRVRWRKRSRRGLNPLEVAPLFIPYLGDGERNNPDARGAFVGLSLRHDRAAIAYATLEGVAFAVRSVINVLVDGGCRFAELRVSGGAARYAIANQLKADALRRPVLTLRIDATTVGAAMLGAIGAGYQRDVQNMMSELVGRGEVLYPSDLDSRIERERAAWYDRVVGAPALQVRAGDLDEVSSAR
jgi:xylulokinase